MPNLCEGELWRCHLPECDNEECIRYLYVLRRHERELEIIEEYETGAQTVKPNEDFL